MNIGDVVIYGTTGACEIIDICKKTVCGTEQSYYALRPVFDSALTLYVPQKSEHLLSRIKQVMSDDQIHSLINALPDLEPLWIDNDKERQETYKQIIQSGDRKQIARIIRTLFEHEERQLKAGKKLHIADERILKEAQDILHNELAFVLNMSPEEVIPYITKTLEKK